MLDAIVGLADLSTGLKKEAKPSCFLGTAAGLGTGLVFRLVRSAGLFERPWVWTYGDGVTVRTDSLQGTAGDACTEIIASAHGGGMKVVNRCIVPSLNLEVNQMLSWLPRVSSFLRQALLPAAPP